VRGRAPSGLAFSSDLSVVTEPQRRGPRPPRFEPGPVSGTSWTVLRSVDSEGNPLRLTPFASQRGWAGDRVCECKCSCGTVAMVREAQLYKRTSVMCASCASSAQIAAALAPVLPLTEEERAEAAAIADMKRRRAADRIRLTERARVMELRRNGLQ
jgi:hypothetical protein